MRYLLQFSPDGFKGYFHEMSELVEYPAPPERARMVATAARFGCVVTRPDP